MTPKKPMTAAEVIKSEQRKAKLNRLVNRFCNAWRASEAWRGVVIPASWSVEYRPWLDTKHRIDFAFPAVKVAIEIEGGIWSGGRHTRGAGFEADCAKYNRLTMEGWAVIRLTSSMLDCKTVSQVQDFILTRLKTLSA